MLRELGDRAFDDLVRRCRTIVGAAAAAAGGNVVNTEGDGMFLVFTDAASAVDAGVDAQLGLRTEAWPNVAPTLRMGVHVGDGRAVSDVTDYVGLGVHQAARVAGAANGEQVLLSESTVEAVAGRWPDGVGATDLGVFVVRDFDEPARLYEAWHAELPAQVAPPCACRPSCTTCRRCARRSSAASASSKTSPSGWRRPRS